MPPSNLEVAIPWNGMIAFGCCLEMTGRDSGEFFFNEI